MLYMDSECVMAGIEVKKRYVACNSWEIENRTEVGGPCTYTTLDCREFGVKGDTWGERLGNIRGIMVPRSLLAVDLFFQEPPGAPWASLGPMGSWILISPGTVTWT